VHDQRAPDERFEHFLYYLAEHATDGRNFVKKGVNWALRQIGKRSRYLNRCAVATARRMRKLDSRAARWIASAALRELTSEKVKVRLKV
jgi:3-methyladenine DNA glycosylase AlkD